jgi:c-di-GMP-binding flagellar brake protein YcgR
MDKDRRKYERVQIPRSAGIYATDDVGKRLGAVRELGLGGMLVETKVSCHEGDMLSLVLVDESENIRRHVKTVSCYETPEGVGFHFHTLEPQAAIEVGIIIGKHHSAKH